MTHYSSVLSLKTPISEGEGECGMYGRISGFPGHITCKRCQEIYKAENSAANVALERSNHYERNHS